MAYNLGDIATVTATFRKVSDNSLVDPATVRAKVRDPRGHITTYTYGGGQIVRVSVGLYTLNVTLNRPSEWLIRWEGNSSNETAGEMTVFATGSLFYDSSGTEVADS